MANQFTDDNFQSEVLDHKGVPVLVDFFAEWCGPCKMLSPVIDQIAEDLGDKIKIGKLDVDTNPEIAQKYMVTSIPTILIIKDGEVVEKIMGFQSQEALEEKLEKHV